jgi:hypothetical protein
MRKELRLFPGSVSPNKKAVFHFVEHGLFGCRMRAFQLSPGALNICIKIGGSLRCRPKICLGKRILTKSPYPSMAMYFFCSICFCSFFGKLRVRMPFSNLPWISASVTPSPT